MKAYDVQIKKVILEQLENEIDFAGNIIREAEEVATIQYGTVSLELEKNLIDEGYIVENVMPFCKVRRP